MYDPKNRPNRARPVVQDKVLVAEAMTKAADLESRLASEKARADDAERKLANAMHRERAKDERLAKTREELEEAQRTAGWDVNQWKTRWKEANRDATRWRKLAETAQGQVRSYEKRTAELLDENRILRETHLIHELRAA